MTQPLWGPGEQAGASPGAGQPRRSGGEGPRWRGGLIAIVAAATVVGLGVVVTGVMLVSRLLEESAAGDIEDYVAVPDLCEQVDVSAVFAVLPAEDESLRPSVHEAEEATYLECSLQWGHEGSTADLWIDVTVYSDAGDAGRRHANNVGGGRMDEVTAQVDEVEGVWEEGALGVGAVLEEFTAGAEACVRDRNLSNCVRLMVSSHPDEVDPPGDEQVGAAVLEVAERVLEVSADPPSPGATIPAGEGGFAPVPELCESDAAAPAYELLPLAEMVRDEYLEGSIYQHGCVMGLFDGDWLGNLRLDVRIYNSAPDAQSAYQRAMGSSTTGGTSEPVDEGWDNATLVVNEDTGVDTVTELFVHEAELMMRIYFSTMKEIGDVDAQRSAVMQIADNLRELLRQ